MAREEFLQEMVLVGRETTVTFGVSIDIADSEEREELCVTWTTPAT